MSGWSFIVSIFKLTLAKIEDIEELAKVRKRCIKETYTANLTQEQIESLTKYDPKLVSFEKNISKGTVYLLKDKEKIEGYAHMKFTPRSGDNGVCTLEAIYPSKRAIREGILKENLEAIEYVVKKAGCYKITGVATEPEMKILSEFGYKESAPGYRHTRDGVTINYVPFTKTLFFPEL